MTAQDIILTIAGIYTITIAMMMQTANAKSALVFKVTPFFIGLACLYAAWALK